MPRAPQPKRDRAAKSASKSASKSAPKNPPKDARKSAPKRQAKKGEERAGRVALVGRPNVGKSTLLNALIGQRLAIITPKPGTTRSVLLGVHDAVDEEGRRTQIAFLDTPGLESPRSVLGRVVVEEAQGALEGLDAVVVMLDASELARSGRLSPSDQRVLSLVEPHGVPIVLALNKVDRVRDKAQLLPALDTLGRAEVDGRPRFAAIVPMSATREVGLDGLVAELRPLLGQTLLYDDDTLTDRSERFFAAELVREAILSATHEEVPYGVAVLVDEWVEEGNLVRIGVTIVVEKSSHKGILIGARGQKLKEIGEASRLAIEGFLGRKVFLRTFVKVVPGWTKDAEKVRRLVHDGALP